MLAFPIAAKRRNIDRFSVVIALADRIQLAERVREEAVYVYFLNTFRL